MRTLLVALLFTLLLTGSAAAKGILGAKVCGADGCVAFGTVAGGESVLEGGPPTSAPKQKAAFYRIRVKVGESKESFGFVRTLYVPSVQMVRADDGTWMNPPTTTITALNRLTRGVRPYPAERLDDTFKPYESSAAAATTPGPSRPSTDGGGGPPAVLWAGLAALVLAGLGVVGWRRHNPVEAG